MKMRGNTNCSLYSTTYDSDNAERLVTELVLLREEQGRYTKKVGDNVIVVPTVHSVRITPHTEDFQAVVWHCLVSHPALVVTEAKWESLEGNEKGAG